jgi:gliding motility-associated-like protein
MTIRTVCFSFFGILITLSAHGQIVSDFSVDADGWTNFNTSSGSTSSLTYNATGGNPSGYVSFTASTSPGVMYFNAPAKFIGNQSPSYNQTLSFDLMQSAAGTDNTANDLVLANGALVLVYQLPTKPGTTWTSYSVLLKETVPGWHVSTPVGTAPTKDQMKQALASLTALRIRVKYQAGSAAYTGSLDNVVLTAQSVPTPPTVTSISPSLGVPNSTTVTITGTNFDSTPSQNIVFFNGVRATPLSASATQLTVKVPQGAQFGRITVVNLTRGLSAQSLQNFSPQFNNNQDYGGRIIPASLAPKVGIALDPTTTDKTVFSVGDVDGDGWNDLVVSELATGVVSIWRNLQVSGAITTASFAPKVSFPLTYTSGKGNTVLNDFDGDGKLDLIVGTSDGGNAHIGIFRNTSTPGTISFTTADYMAATSYVDGPLQTADIDGDGRPELLSTWDNSSGGSNAYFTVFPNLSTPGDIEFAPYLDFDFSILQQSGAISTGDLDGDGKLDVAVVSGFDSEFYIFQNTSTPGSFSFNTPFAMNVGGSAHYVAIADLDNDSKLDLVWNGYTTNSILISKNISTPGTLSAASFGAAITITSPLGYIQGKVAVADMNSDSKPDIVLAGSTDMAVFQNQATTGILNANSFLPGVPYQGISPYAYFVGPVLADLNSDGKPDILLGETTGATPLHIDLYQNLCYPVPVVTTAAPSPATTGQMVTLTGDLMQTGTVAPLATVREGVLKTTSNSPSNTTTTFTVPPGGQSDLLSVTVHGLTTTNPLSVTFPTSHVIDATSFPTNVNFPLSGSMRNTLTTADWDDDGKPDVGLIDGTSSGKLFQNTQSAAGPITTASLTQLSTTFSSSGFMMAFDIDGDGKTDMHSGNSLFRNSSTGGVISFESSPAGVSTGASGFTYATKADFNNDGKIDVASVSGTNVVLYENLSRAGSFTNTSYFTTFGTAVDFARPASGGGIIAVDLDGDGFNDIAANNAGSNNFSYYKNQGINGPITTASFAAAVNVATGLQPYGIIAADFDGDGAQDIAITHYNAANNYVSVYRNTSSAGTISFAAPVNLPCLKNGFDIIAQDMDGDGKPEIIVIHQPSPGPGSFSVFQNTSISGTPSFAAAVNYALPLHNPQFVAAADINLDNKPDLLIVAFAVSTGNNALLVIENKIAPPTITIQTQPLPSASVCSGVTQTFTTLATGTTNITYQWQVFNSGTGTYVDLTNSGGYSNVSTPTLSINTTGNFGAGTYQCKISGDAAATVYTNPSVLTLATSGCTPNQPPVIAPTEETTTIGGEVTLNLSTIISDPDNNLDLSTLVIVSQPKSGAVATLDANHQLTVNYSGISFSGVDTLTLQVCDSASACTQQKITIEVAGSVIVYNAVSPNGDGKNDVFVLEFIDVLSTTQHNQVQIFNRWGDQVFSITDYDNTTRVFAGISSDGKQLPPGTYFYKVTFPSGAKTLKGYLEIKR